MRGHEVEGAPHLERPRPLETFGFHPHPAGHLLVERVHPKQRGADGHALQARRRLTQRVERNERLGRQRGYQAFRDRVRWDGRPIRTFMAT